MKLKKLIFTIGALAITLPLAISCGGKKNDAAAEADSEAEQVFAVSTLTTAAGNLDDYLEFGGDISSVNSVAALPDQGGKITNILVNVGDMVNKGQVIA